MLPFLFTLAALAMTVNASAADVSETQSGLLGIFNTLRAISIPGAAISVAVNGVIYMVAGDKGAETAKKGIIYTLIAVAAVWILPLAMSIGRGAFSSGAGFNPYSPGA